MEYKDPNLTLFNKKPARESIENAVLVAARNYGGNGVMDLKFYNLFLKDSLDALQFSIGVEEELGLEFPVDTYDHSLFLSLTLGNVKKKNGRTKANLVGLVDFIENLWK